MVRTLRVLVVEDSPDDAEMMALALQSSGIAMSFERVETAAALRAALAAGPWDAVLSDYSLPEFGAIEALAIIREFDPHLPFLVVSGTVGEDIAAAMMRIGANDYVLKRNLVRLGPALDREVRETENRRARHAAEKALRESEARYRTLFEAARDGILIVDPLSRKILDTNPFLAELLGYRREELTGKELWEIGLFQDIEANKATFHSLQDRGYIRYDDLPLLTRDGRQIQVEFVSNIYSVGDAKVVQCNIRDITERKLATEAMRSSEQRFRAFMDHTPAAAFIKDEEGRFLYVNTTWQRQFGVESLQWQGKTNYDYWPRETVDIFHASDELCLSINAPVQAEATGLNAAGVEFTWLMMKFPLEEGGLRRIGVIAWDISDRKRAEEKLLLLNRAVNAATQGILITDAWLPDSPIIYASPGFERLTGYAAAEVMNRNCRFLQGAETDPAAIKQIRESIRLERPCTVVLRNYRKDGTPFWNELSLSPVKDAAGKLTHFVGVQTDVTAQRQLEEQFRQAQKMEAVGQLAGGVAHDFNNLLTIINGYSEILIDSHDESDPTRAMLLEIHKAGARSAGLTRQLLAFSRQQVLNPKVLDLNEVIGEAQKMLGRLIGEDIELRIALAPRLDAVTADPGQIEQVLMNLLVNARDAMPQGGRLTIETGNVELGEDYCRSHPEAKPGRYAMLAVKDTGSGMTEAVRRRLFEPFFTTKGKDKGTGLGLAVVHGIVRQSNGTVDVQSELGVGTTFRIYLPRVEQSASPAGSRLTLGPAPRGSETILLVEDEDAVRALTLRNLRLWGYVVLEATNGKEALRIAEKFAEPIQLLMTDVVMPGMGGSQLAERLLASQPAMKVLYLSGYTDDAVIRHGIQHDLVNFLQKPFSPLTLAHKVREILTPI